MAITSSSAAVRPDASNRFLIENECPIELSSFLIVRCVQVTATRWNRRVTCSARDGRKGGIADRTITIVITLCLPRQKPLDISLGFHVNGNRHHRWPRNCHLLEVETAEASLDARSVNLAWQWPPSLAAISKSRHSLRTTRPAGTVDIR
jgi:hypothetical protein